MPTTAEVIAEHGKHEKDSGTPEVQIALLEGACTRRTITPAAA
jgi:ribosomal protein S15P/S13E